MKPVSLISICLLVLATLALTVVGDRGSDVDDGGVPAGREDDPENHPGFFRRMKERIPWHRRGGSRGRSPSRGQRRSWGGGDNHRGYSTDEDSYEDDSAESEYAFEWFKNAWDGFRRRLPWGRSRCTNATDPACQKNANANNGTARSEAEGPLDETNDNPWDNAESFEDALESTLRSTLSEYADEFDDPAEAAFQTNELLRTMEKSIGWMKRKMAAEAAAKHYSMAQRWAIEQYDDDVASELHSVLDNLEEQFDGDDVDGANYALETLIAGYGPLTQAYRAVGEMGPRSVPPSYRRNGRKRRSPLIA